VTARGSRGRYDAVVVGAGPNGLVAANVLADAGRSVLLLEAADRVGGGARTAELTLRGFHHDVCSTAHPLAVVSPALRSMGLDQLGVTFLHGAEEFAHPLEGEPDVLVSRSVDLTVQRLGTGGPGWRRLTQPFRSGGLDLVATVLDPLSVPRAPLAAARYGATAALPATALARLLGSGRARAMLAGLAAHSMLDLGAPLTGGLGVLLGGLAHLGGWPVIAGGSQQLSDALAARLMARGGDVVTGQTVTALTDLPPARRVLLDVSPRDLLGILGASAPPKYRAALAGFRYGAGVFKVDWALDGPIPWRDPRTAAAPTVHLGGTYEEIAASEREVARGGHPEQPFVLLVQAGAADGGRAPAGQQTAWAYCHVPNGSRVDRTDVVERQVERFAPGFRDLVLARHTMDTSAVQAHDRNDVGGDISAGALGVRQMLARPVAGVRPWRTPVPGVYLCSASTPPGPGVHGMCGWLAARTALADDARGRPVLATGNVV
jgi:phytoene dehydrogenase-like protein